MKSIFRLPFVVITCTSYVKHTTSWIKLITYIWLLHVEYYAQHMANSVVMNIFFFNFQVCGISLLKYTLRPNAHDKQQQDDIYIPVWSDLIFMVLSIGLTTNILMHAYILCVMLANREILLQFSAKLRPIVLLYKYYDVHSGKQIWTGPTWIYLAKWLINANSAILQVLCVRGASGTWIPSHDGDSVPWSEAGERVSSIRRPHHAHWFWPLVKMWWFHINAPDHLGSEKHPTQGPPRGSLAVSVHLVFLHTTQLYSPRRVVFPPKTQAQEEAGPT